MRLGCGRREEDSVEGREWGSGAEARGRKWKRAEEERGGFNNFYIYLSIYIYIG